MIQLQPILVNGANYSWGNLTNIVLGAPAVGITAINFRRTQKKENNYGLGMEPISRGYGNVEYEGSFSCYREFLQAIINASPNKDILQVLPVDWKMVFGQIPGVPSFIVTLKNFEFTEESLKASQGDTKLIQDIPFIFAGIQY